MKTPKVPLETPEKSLPNKYTGKHDAPQEESKQIPTLL